jgi:hypothetical protein
VRETRKVSEVSSKAWRKATHAFERSSDDVSDNLSSIDGVDALIAEVLSQELAPLVKEGTEAFVVGEEDARVTEVDAARVDGADEGVDDSLEATVGDQAGLLLLLLGCSKMREVSDGVPREKCIDSPRMSLADFFLSTSSLAFLLALLFFSLALAAFFFFLVAASSSLSSSSSSSDCSSSCWSPASRRAAISSE